MLLVLAFEAYSCFESQPGQLVKSPESVRQSQRSFIGLKGKFDLKVQRVFQTSDLALVTAEWLFSRTGPDGNPVNMAAKSAKMPRHQVDGTWRFVLDKTWGDRPINRNNIE